MTTHANYPSKVSGIIESESDGEIMLYSPGSEQALALNRSSAVIWRLCDSKTSVDQMISELTAAFPESADQIKNDVTSAIDALSAAGVISMVEAVPSE